MHSIKGGWVGQTFALARRNESDGRKSRIRRSKEERKAMVESFIKKYQESNNGNFPSLNLTHKEVGGSFYTVREIVRDIIQENRVLGPAKFTLEELTSDQFFEQNPLGSIARDPQSSFAASSNGNHPEPNNHLDTSGMNLSVSVSEVEHHGVDNGHIVNVRQVDVLNKEWMEATVVSDGYYGGAEHLEVDKENFVNVNQVDRTDNEFVEAAVVSDGYTGADDKSVDNELVINGSPVDLIKKEPSEATNPEMQVSEPMEPKSVAQDLATTATPLAKVTLATEDLIVETFPIRPVTGTTDEIEALGDLRNSSDSQENYIKILDLEKGQERSEGNVKEPAMTSNLHDEKFTDSLGNQILKKNAGQDEEMSLGDALAESAKHSAHKKHLGHGFEDCTEPQVRVSHQNTVTSEAINQSQIIDGVKTSIQDGLQAKILTNTCTEGSKPSEEIPQKANIHRVDGQSQRRSNTTLDRINLESWDGASKNSGKQETNPLLAIFKAFVDAFVKFWSE